MKNENKSCVELGGGGGGGGGACRGDSYKNASKTIAALVSRLGLAVRH